MCASDGHDPFPRVARAARVRSNREIAPSVFELSIDRAPDANPPLDNGATSGVVSDEIPFSFPGQFFMLRARPSGVLLGRPISVYRADDSLVAFLILRKGRGTEELCDLRAGDSLDLVGPIGNRFTPPEEISGSASSGPPRVAIIGGGIGVAPVAGFALGLAPRSFDFYAAFRSSPYGLDGLEARARNLIIATEDGSSGVKGMLPAVFDAARYDLVYACGPTPMLRFVQTACAEAREKSVSSQGERAGINLGGKASPRAFLSLEEHMACGAGACLGCTVRTVHGNRRCCVDGPVFEDSEVLL